MERRDTPELGEERRKEIFRALVEAQDTAMGVADICLHLMFADAQTAPSG